MSFVNYMLSHLLKENKKLLAIVHFKEQNVLTVCMVVDRGMMLEKVE